MDTWKSDTRRRAEELGAGIDRRMNIVLVGFMGTGKTTIGRLLAQRLRRNFMDTDRWIVGYAGMTIPELFERFGEQAFRDTETEAARHVSTLEGHVVSTGGGILGRPENVELLRQNGHLVCLVARPEVILARTAPWENRPMLRTAANPQEAVERLLAERAPQYAQADFQVDTSDLSSEQVIEQICDQLRSR